METKLIVARVFYKFVNLCAREQELVVGRLQLGQHIRPLQPTGVVRIVYRTSVAECHVGHVNNTLFTAEISFGCARPALDKII